MNFYHIGHNPSRNYKREIWCAFFVTFSITFEPQLANSITQLPCAATRRAAWVKWEHVTWWGSRRYGSSDLAREGLVHLGNHHTCFWVKSSITWSNHTFTGLNFEEHSSSTLVIIPHYRDEWARFICPGDIRISQWVLRWSVSHLILITELVSSALAMYIS